MFSWSKFRELADSIHRKKSKAFQCHSNFIFGSMYPHFHDGSSSEVIQQTIDYGAAVRSSYYSKKPSVAPIRNYQNIVSYSIAHNCPSPVDDRSMCCQTSQENIKDVSCSPQVSSYSREVGSYNPDICSGDRKIDTDPQPDSETSKETVVAEISSQTEKNPNSKMQINIHKKKGKKHLGRICLPLKLSCFRWNVIKKSPFRKSRTTPVEKEPVSVPPSCYVEKPLFKEFGTEMQFDEPKMAAIVTSKWLKQLHSTVLRDAAGETSRLPVSRKLSPIFVSALTSNEGLMVKKKTVSFNGGSFDITRKSTPNLPVKFCPSRWADAVINRIIQNVSPRSHKEFKSQSCETWTSPVKLISFSNHPRSFHSSITLAHHSLRFMSDKSSHGNSNFNDLGTQNSRPGLPLCPSDLAEKVAKKIILHMQKSKTIIDHGVGISVGTVVACNVSQQEIQSGILVPPENDTQCSPEKSPSTDLKSTPDCNAAKLSKQEIMRKTSSQPPQNDAQPSGDSIKLNLCSTPKRSIVSFNVSDPETLSSVMEPPENDSQRLTETNDLCTDVISNPDGNESQTVIQDILRETSEQPAENDSPHSSNSTKVASTSALKSKEVLACNVSSHENRSSISGPPLNNSHHSTETNNLVECTPEYNPSQSSKQEIMRETSAQPPENDSRHSNGSIKITSSSTVKSKPGPPENDSQHLLETNDPSTDLKCTPDCKSSKQKLKVLEETSAQPPENDSQRSTDSTKLDLSSTPKIKQGHNAIRLSIMSCIQTQNADNDSQHSRDSKGNHDLESRPEKSTSPPDCNCEDSRTLRINTGTDPEDDDDFANTVKQLASHIAAEVEILKTYALKAYPQLRQTYSCENKIKTPPRCNRIVQCLESQISTAFSELKVNHDEAKQTGYSDCNTEEKMAPIITAQHSEIKSGDNVNSDQQFQQNDFCEKGVDVLESIFPLSARSVDHKTCQSSQSTIFDSSCKCQSSNYDCQCTKLRNLQVIDLNVYGSKSETRHSNTFSKTKRIQVPLSNNEKKFDEDAHSQYSPLLDGTRFLHARHLNHCDPLRFRSRNPPQDWSVCYPNMKTNTLKEAADCEFSFVQYISNLVTEKMARFRCRFNNREEPFQTCQGLFRAMQVLRESNDEQSSHTSNRVDDESQTSFVESTPMSKTLMKKVVVKPPDDSYKPRKQPKSVWHTKICTIHRGRGYESCESRSTWCVRMRQSCLVNHAFSVTNICSGHEKEDLRAVYYMLSAMEGRIKRVKRSNGIF